MIGKLTAPKWETNTAVFRTVISGVLVKRYESTRVDQIPVCNPDRGYDRARRSRRSDTSPNPGGADRCRGSARAADHDDQYFERSHRRRRVLGYRGERDPVALGRVDRGGGRLRPLVMEPEATQAADGSLCARDPARGLACGFSRGDLGRGAAHAVSQRRPDASVDPWLSDGRDDFRRGLLPIDGAASRVGLYLDDRARVGGRAVARRAPGIFRRGAAASALRGVHL